MVRKLKVGGALGLSVVLISLGACSTGTVNHQLFAHTQDETYARVRSAVPLGTPLSVAQETLKAMGWSCYTADRGSVTPNDTRQRVHGTTLSCEAYPSFGGYPFSKEYSAEFLVESGKVGLLQVIISDPAI